LYIARLKNISIIFHLACVLVLPLIAVDASADEMRPSLLRLTQSGNQQWNLSFKQPQINGRFLNLKVKTNCVAGAVTPLVSDTALQENYALTCGPEGLSRIQIDGLERTLVDTMVTILASNGQETNHLISSSQPVLFVGESAPAVPVYVILGVEHLIFGIDHVLFVLVLLYVVRGWKNLLKVITSFTVAHSITLGLSSLQIMTLAQAPVEALISLSIVFLAAEAIRKDKGYMTRAPWVVSALFGLLHGLGFAGALAEIGLPKESAVVALLLFNVGIEIGQLAVVAGALASVALLNRLVILDSNQALTYTVMKVPLYCAGCVAGYWFVERVLTIAV